MARIEDWDPAGRQFDAVVAGQAWHWVDPVAGARRAAQALRPGGRLAVFWKQLPAPTWPGRSHGRGHGPGGTGRADAGSCPGPTDTRGWVTGRRAGSGRPGPLLKILNNGASTGERPYSRDEWLDAVPTFGGSDRLLASTMGELLAGIGAAIDAIGGQFTMGYTTVVSTAVRSAN